MQKLGVIADDFTGATDIAGFLADNGVSTIQTNGVPTDEFSEIADAFVVSLKSRSCPSDMAVKDSLAALAWLRGRGCNQIFFKYCSTFDSTAAGNIGPVTDALLDAMHEDITILCPALPINGRTVYKGYLFVHDQLLNESGMQNHPVTPMHDAKISRVMESQAMGKALNIYVETIAQGPGPLRKRIEEARQEGYRYVVVDAVSQDHLDFIAVAVRDLPLLTGGSGLAASLARMTLHDETRSGSATGTGLPSAGKTVILAGSCSAATNVQVSRYRTQAPSLALDLEKCLTDPTYVQQLLDWALQHIANDCLAPLLYATMSPEELEKTRTRFAGQDIGTAIEAVFGALASELGQACIQNFIVAGGETAGAIVQSLDLSGFHIGPQIDPGVPWVKAVEKPLYLALKSGNFGSDDFFIKAQEMCR